MQLSFLDLGIWFICYIWKMLRLCDHRTSAQDRLIG